MKSLPQIDAFSTIPSHDESRLRAQSLERERTRLLLNLKVLTMHSRR
jgi:hypothetical protein